jgi:hypothetical protein
MGEKSEELEGKKAPRRKQRRRLKKIKKSKTVPISVVFNKK